MKIFIYNYRDFDEKPFFEKHCKEYGVEYEYTPEYPTLENIEENLRGKGYEALSIIVYNMSAPILEKLYDVGIRHISSRSVGVDHFDLQKAKELGMTISNTPYSPNSVANYAIMLMLMCCRSMKHIMDRNNVQDFSLKGKLGKELSISTVGVIGTGKVGSTVVEHLSGFGCKIICYDIYQNDRVKEIAEYVDDINTIYREADIITLHVPSLPENYHMIGKEQLDMMKDGVILVNTARGDAFDTYALIEAIESGKIHAAGLDVVENEHGLYYVDLMGKPLDKRELGLLRAFPNVIITPHTAFYTEQASSNMVENSIKGLVCELQGKENPFRIPL